MWLSRPAAASAGEARGRDRGTCSSWQSMRVMRMVSSLAGIAHSACASGRVEA